MQNLFLLSFDECLVKISIASQCHYLVLLRLFNDPKAQSGLIWQVNQFFLETGQDEMLNTA